MDTEQLQRLTEALLFVSDGPVETRRLEAVLEVDGAALEDALRALTETSQQRGLRVQRHGDAVQMVTIAEAAPYVERLLGVQASSKLSAAAVETLAIVAYKQPVTRAEIEAIRGVNVDRALSTLQTRGLVAEAGRMEGPGRPILYATTFEFLQHFGLRSTSDLPPLAEDHNE